ncbi:acyltransferase family protein [Frateuria sp. GZRR35]|uniref:acyltransferase family protein n=1 Tax=unclassified Frateuria TaxID=2648894 RepID=UPI003EDC4E81
MTIDQNTPGALIGRDTRIDNAKFLLIFFVVFGHCLEQIRYQAAFLEALYQFIYLFHMPAFIYLSGMLSRAEFGAKQGARWLATLILPLLVFQAIYLALDAWMLHKPFSYQVIQPYWGLWYLASLACWRIMLVPILTLRQPIFLACIIAIISGYSNDVDYAFSLSRTLVFFPFFVAGHLLGLPNKGARPAAWFTLLLLAIFAWSIRHLNAQWLYGVTPYTNRWGGLIQLGLLACSAAGVWAVLRLAWHKSGPLAFLGRQSLPIYLLHGLLIKLSMLYGLWIPVRKMDPAVGLAVAAVAAFLLVCFLALCAPLFRPIMDYSWVWRAWGANSTPRDNRSHVVVK